MTNANPDCPEMDGGTPRGSVVFLMPYPTITPHHLNALRERRDWLASDQHPEARGHEAMENCRIAAFFHHAAFVASQAKPS